ncbi:MAG TPA: UDP-N-acetylglucosamine 1-carboxyvinyltransferase [Anaerolineae bacterium]|nr:UDP-N-acetylglucosamine 1-carboxyvinyltransferase [Anaerolineae bacterium]HQJ50214.1 UDP-N-acetylglucosamine 1-carboxyvinyltransferase [Anaerolineae bacterium]
MLLVVEGRHKLEGEIAVAGAKNAALPILAATLLTSDECHLENLPDIEDIRNMVALLRQLGADVRVDGNRRVVARASALTSSAIPEELAVKMRGSFLTVGALLGRLREASAPHPGGCAIGARPVGVDLKGFQAMGTEISQGNGRYTLRAPSLKGGRISLDYPSHTGTENLLLAACLAEGTTIIENASVEPEVADLANLLNAMGARIYGAGTGIIQVEGVQKLHGAAYRVMPDRLEAGTYAIAAAITGGSVAIRGRVARYLGALSSKLGEIGVSVSADKEVYHVQATDKLAAVDIRTFPYPGFPTDLQAPIGALLTQARGESSIHETMYDARLLYVSELQKMGADIGVLAQTAVIKGPCSLHGSQVRALDIRSGAAVILATLVAEGTSEISGVGLVDRGYDGIDIKLAALGARIQRVA